LNNHSGIVSIVDITYIDKDTLALLLDFEYRFESVFTSLNHNKKEPCNE
jgi:hypothetical protein